MSRTEENKYMNHMSRTERNEWAELKKINIWINKMSTEK